MRRPGSHSRLLGCQPRRVWHGHPQAVVLVQQGVDLRTTQGLQRHRALPPEHLSKEQAPAALQPAGAAAGTTKAARAAALAGMSTALAAGAACCACCICGSLASLRAQRTSVSVGRSSPSASASHASTAASCQACTRASKSWAASSSWELPASCRPSSTRACATGLSARLVAQQPGGAKPALVVVAVAAHGQTRLGSDHALLQLVPCAQPRRLSPGSTRAHACRSRLAADMTSSLLPVVCT